LTRASEQIIRIASSWRLISREKIATGSFCRVAAFTATLRTSEVFPIPGRAATTIMLDRWNPAVTWSRSRKPDATPVIRSFRSYASSISFIASRAISPIA
jgi:hypothetical protein